MLSTEMEIEVDLDHWTINLVADVQYEDEECESSSTCGNQEVTERWVERYLFDYDIKEFTRFFSGDPELLYFIPEHEKQHTDSSKLLTHEIDAIRRELISALDDL